MTAHDRPEATQDARCAEEHREVRCERLAGHTGFHSGDGLAWGFRNVPEPAWIRRMHEYGLPAKDMTDAG